MRSTPRTVFVAILILALAGPSLAIDEPSEEELLFTPIDPGRGLIPNKPFFSDEGLDFINMATGNLVLTIPIGQVYSVGPLLSYQLRVVNNSNLWDHVRVKCSPPQQSLCASIIPLSTFAIPNRNHNAGLGWEFHFGKLYSPIPPAGSSDFLQQSWPGSQGVDSPDLTTRWLFVAPDGGTHTLHLLQGRDNGTGSLPIRYSKDGSFLRMRQVDPTTVHVERPDGVVSVFKRVGNVSAGTNFCGGSVSGCWRFSKMIDPYGNEVAVSYLIVGSEELWTITDSTGRSHTARFSLTDADTGGGDGAPPFVTPDGDEWGDHRRILTQVELAAFAGRRASWAFFYETRTLTRGCPHDGDRFPGNQTTITTPILATIQPPDSQPYRFETLTFVSGRCNNTNGRVTEVTVPSRARISYTYGPWVFPTRCIYTNTPEAEYTFHGYGVTSKSILKPDGIVEGTWTISSRDLFPFSSELTLSGANCSRANYRRTILDGPTVDGKRTREIFYNSVAQGPRTPSSTTTIDQWQVTDAGLPYSKDFSIGASAAAKRFLSQRTYECAAAGCTVLRSRYVRYASEFRGCGKAFGDSAGCYQVNPLPLRERTTFHDDGGKWIETLNELYDGAGQFRRIRTLDNLSGATKTRTDVTNYTVTGTTRPIDADTGYVDRGTPSAYLPAPGEPWILHPFNFRQSTENGRTYRTDFFFNSHGTPACTRQRKDSGARMDQDVVTNHVLGATPGVNAGLPVSTRISGGDLASGIGGGICSLSSDTASGSRYTTVNTYQHLELASSRFSGFPFAFRADVDRDTGLHSRVFNVSAQATTLDYDLLGRVTRVTPAATLGQAESEIVYKNPPGDNPSIEISLLDGTEVLTKRIRTFDHRSRLIETVTRRPTGSSFQELARGTSYDVLGRVRQRSTLQNRAAVDLSRGTFFEDYNPFGRPRRITTPGSKVRTLSYLGARRIDGEVEVRTSTGGFSKVTTSEIFDAQGRLEQAINPEYTTLFSHDPAGNRTSAVRQGGSGSQTRLFGFDGRGFLTSEQLPEVGAGGNGTVTYTRDARGLARRVENGASDLTNDFDQAGRLTSVRSTTGRQRIREEFAYGTSNTSTNFRLGRLVRSVRHNYPPGGPWAIQETYSYRNGHGRISHKTTQIQYPDLVGDQEFGATFTLNWDYDPLGNVIRESYPRCIAASQTGVALCNDAGEDRPGANHTVTTTFSESLPVRVDSTHGHFAAYAYHTNLQTSRIDYSNGAAGIFSRGTDGLRRARRIRYQLGATSWFDSGAYRYDGARNIWGIGSERYSYDGAGRLLSGTVKKAGAERSESYTYDAFDNVTSVRRDGGATQSLQVSSVSNHLVNDGGTGGAATYGSAGNLVSLGSVSLDYDRLNVQTRYEDSSDGTDLVSIYGPGNLRLVVWDRVSGEKTVKLRDLAGRVARQYLLTGPKAGRGPGGERWRFGQDFTYGPKGLIATRATAATSTLFFHQDHLGTPRVISNHDGSQQWFHHYYPYGTEVPPATAQVDDPTVKFTGHERDPHGKMDYMRARTYAFPQMRFTTVDPGRDGWNLYSYVGGNPINRIDPTGRAEEEARVVAVTAGSRFSLGLFGLTTRVGFAKDSTGNFGIVSQASGSASANAKKVTKRAPVGFTLGDGSLTLNLGAVSLQVINKPGTVRGLNRPLRTKGIAKGGGIVAKGDDIGVDIRQPLGAGVNLSGTAVLDNQTMVENRQIGEANLLIEELILRGAPTGFEGEADQDFQDAQQFLLFMQLQREAERQP